MHYFLVLERCHSDNVNPKKDAFCKMMTVSIFNSITTLRTFNISAGVGYDNIKKHMVKLFESETIMGCQSSNQAEATNGVLYWFRVLLHFLDGHADKMKKNNGFDLPDYFDGMIGRTEGTTSFKKVNKQSLERSETDKLQKYSNNLCLKLQLVSIPNIIHRNIFTAISELRKTVDAHDAYAINHSTR